jgi:transposase, IS5 family
VIRDWPSFMRFLGLGLADTVPDANTIWGFRETLTRARIAGRPAIEVLYERFDAALAAAGFLAMSGQIIDASIVAAPKQRYTEGEKRDIREGRIPPAYADSRPGCHTSGQLVSARVLSLDSSPPTGPCQLLNLGGSIH